MLLGTTQDMSNKTACVHIWGFISTPIHPDFLPRNAVLVKGSLLDFHLLCANTVWVRAEKQKLPHGIHQDYQQEGRTASGLRTWPIVIYGRTPTEVSAARTSPLSQQF